MIDGLAVLVKLLLYAGALISAGTGLAVVSWRRRCVGSADVAPMIIGGGAILVVVASVANVTVLLARLGGGFDAAMFAMIMDTPTGTAATLQVAGAILSLVSVWLAPRVGVVTLGGAILVLASFGVNGHAAAEGAAAGFIAILHVGVAAWWLGGLLMLCRACQVLDTPNLATCVQHFSRQALVVVGVLLTSGTILIIIILGIDHLPHWTAYVRTLSTKLLLVSAVLAAAAFNRLRITPQLAVGDAGAALALRRSISVETSFFAAVLAATAWLTTFHSPHE